MDSQSSAVASQEARSAEEGTKVESGHGSVKRAILKRLEERYPDKHVPWGDFMKAADGFDYAYFAQVARTAGYSYLGRPREGRQRGQARQFIENEIATKYPCMEIPRGLVNEWAKKFGVSRQRVHQIVLDYGGRSYAKKKREFQGRTCNACGEPTNSNTQRFCEEHRVVRLTCESCGKEFSMPWSSVNGLIKQAYRVSQRENARGGGGILRTCRKSCRSDMAIEFITRNPETPTYLLTEKFGVSPGRIYQWRAEAKKRLATSH